MPAGSVVVWRSLGLSVRGDGFLWGGVEILTGGLGVCGAGLAAVLVITTGFGVVGWTRGTGLVLGCAGG